MPFGDLLGYLRKSRGLNDKYYEAQDIKPQSNLTAEQLMKFAWQVADGMCYLSSEKVSVNFMCDWHPYQHIHTNKFSNWYRISELQVKVKLVVRLQFVKKNTSSELS